MQNNSVLYGIGLVVIVALGFGVWLMFGSKAGEGSLTGTTTQQSATSGGTLSLQSLLASNSPQRCTFTSKTENSSSNGTVLVAAGRMRGDFTSMANEKTIASHMIVAGGTSYIWSDALPSGFKMTFNAESSQEAFDQATHDPNTTLEYSCAPWSADASVFALPAGIEFKDMAAASASVQQTSDSPNDIHAAQCGECDKAPDASSRAQCKAMLSC